MSFCRNLIFEIKSAGIIIPSYDKSRVINFSDAVYSIAMTLLVLEIGIPTYKAFSSNDTWTLLAKRIPSFIGLVVSFLVTALYWLEHLRCMRLVSTIDAKLLWLNIFLLFFYCAIALLYRVLCGWF